jgi:hypothetical protein
LIKSKRVGPRRRDGRKEVHNFVGYAESTIKREGTEERIKTFLDRIYRIFKIPGRNFKFDEGRETFWLASGQQKQVFDPVNPVNPVKTAHECFRGGTPLPQLSAFLSVLAALAALQHFPLIIFSNVSRTMNRF